MFGSEFVLYVQDDGWMLGIVYGYILLFCLSDSLGSLTKSLTVTHKVTHTVQQIFPSELL